MTTLEPAAAGAAFEIEWDGETIILTPLRNLNEYTGPSIDASADRVFELVDHTLVKNVVVDFHRTDYFGSSALGFFMKLWKRIRQRDGHIAFCNVSDHEKEILRVTHLDRLWPLCPSRREALEVVKV